MSWLKTKTGKGDIYWLRRVGVLIGKHVSGKKIMYKGNLHDECYPPDWVIDLSNEIQKRTKLGKKYDENMHHASVLSYLLMKWFVRLVRAKAYDPRRPAKIRQQMMKKYSRFCSEVIAFMTDESEDPRHFPSQEWDCPFAKEARDGTYE